MSNKLLLCINTNEEDILALAVYQFGASTEEAYYLTRAAVKFLLKKQSPISRADAIKALEKTGATINNSGIGDFVSGCIITDRDKILEQLNIAETRMLICIYTNERAVAFNAFEPKGTLNDTALEGKVVYTDIVVGPSYEEFLSREFKAIIKADTIVVWDNDVFVPFR